MWIRRMAKIAVSENIINTMGKQWMREEIAAWNGKISMENKPCKISKIYLRHRPAKQWLALFHSVNFMNHLQSDLIDFVANDFASKQNRQISIRHSPSHQAVPQIVFRSTCVVGWYIEMQNPGT